jgi:membrane fusion protein (multidrug efflux system)
MMWVYFNVPEASYLEYMANVGQDSRVPRIELKLANGSKFQYPAERMTIEAKFNHNTGTIPFRADFENPNGLLRHGQSGTVLIHKSLKNALVIPQRAVFDILNKRYVWVVGKDGLVHKREIGIQYELEDIFVVRSGLDVNDKIVVEGVQKLHDGDKVEFQFRKPE